METAHISNGKINGHTPNKRNFIELKNPSELLPILFSRTPLSAHIYNNAKVYDKWANEARWFVLDGDLSENCWILLIVSKSHFGQEISISRPRDSIITGDITEAFSWTQFIQWDESFTFFALDPALSSMIYDISVKVKGNPTTFHPCTFYYMDPQEALQLNDNFNLSEGVEIRDLNNEEGKALQLSTWKYATSQKARDYIDNVLSRNPSVSVHVDGRPVSGVVLAGYGHIGMLYTLKEHRGQGYAQICMHSIMKKLAQNGLIPNAVVEMRNLPSRHFQIKCRMKPMAQTNFIIYEKSGF